MAGNRGYNASRDTPNIERIEFLQGRTRIQHDGHAHEFSLRPGRSALDEQERLPSELGRTLAERDAVIAARTAELQVQRAIALGSHRRTDRLPQLPAAPPTWPPSSSGARSDRDGNAAPRLRRPRSSSADSVKTAASGWQAAMNKHDDGNRVRYRLLRTLQRSSRPPGWRRLSAAHRQRNKRGTL